MQTNPIRAAAGLSRRERVRLWCSYQRYAVLMAVAPTAAVAALAVAWPGAWWLWGPAALGALKMYGFAADIYGRWPRKVRATLLADRRIAAGRFRPEMVQRYCGDPCFRVVAREILRRAGLPPAERRALMTRFTEAEAERGRTLVLINRHDGVLFEMDGHSVRRQHLARTPRAPTPTGECG